MVAHQRIGPDGAFVREIADIRERIKSFETRPAGTIVIREQLIAEDPVTGVKTIVGQLPDGSVGIQPFVGDITPPPVASTPIVTAQPGFFTVAWDGLFVNNEDKPQDFQHVNVIGHEMNGTETVRSLVVGVIRLNTESVLVTQETAAIGDEWQFSLESEDYNRNKAVRSARSASVVMLSNVTDEGVNEALSALTQAASAADVAAQNAQTAADDAQQAADAAAQAAIDAANIADSKGVVYTQSDTPSADYSGLWIDTAHNNLPRRYLGVRSALVVNLGGGASIGTRLSSLGWAVSSISTTPSLDEASKYDLVAMDSGYAGLLSAPIALATKLWDRGISLFTTGNDTTSMPPLFTGASSRSTPKNPIRYVSAGSSGPSAYSDYGDADLNIYLTGVNPSAKITGVTLAASTGTDQPVNLIMEHPTNFARWAHVETYATPVTVLNAHLGWVSDNWVSIQDQGVISAASAAVSAQTTADQAANAAQTAAEAAGTAQDTADGKNTSWRQPDQPAGIGHRVGDLWFDTDDNYTLRTWNGTIWQTAQDSFRAQQTADSKALVYTQTTVPPVEARVATTIWNDTSLGLDKVVQKYWSSTANAWTPLVDKAATDAQITAESKGETIYSTTEPAADKRLPQNLWIDTTGGINIHKRWDGNAWIVAADSRIAATATAVTAAQQTADDAASSAAAKSVVYTQSTTPPVEARLPQTIWNDTSLGLDKIVVKFWNGTAWTATADKTATDAATLAATKTKTYFQPAQPSNTGNTTGDLWFDTDDLNRPYVWNGSAWTLAQDATVNKSLFGSFSSDIDNTAPNKWMFTRYNKTMPSNTTVPSYLDIVGMAGTSSLVSDGATLVNTVGENYVGQLRTIVHTVSAKTVAITATHDDAAQIYVDGVSVYTKAAYTQNAAISFSLTAGWHVLDFMWTEVSGGDGWYSISPTIGSQVTSMFAPVSLSSVTQAVSAAQTSANAAQTSADTAMKAQAYSLNASFDDWTGSTPALSTAFTTAPTKETTIVRRAPFAARWNLADTTTQAGLTFTTSSILAHAPNLEYFTVEVDLYLVSGGLGGAGMILDWSGMTNNRAQINFASEITSPVTGKWYTISKTLRRPTNATGTWTGMAGYLMANWSGHGAGATKNIIFDWFNIRPATSEEILAYSAPAKYTELSAATAAKGEVIYSSSTPAVDKQLPQNLWIDTTGGINIHKRWNGTSWVVVSDTRIAQSVSDISALSSQVSAVSAQADRSITTFYGSTTPSTPESGDLWLTGVAGEPMKRYDGSAWVTFEDPNVQAAYEKAGDAQSAADAKVRTFAQDAEPTGMVPNDIGDLWIDTNDKNKLYRYSGAAWVELRDDTIADAQSKADSAFNVATVKTKTYYQSASPAVTGNTYGDTWYDTDDLNKPYIWNGSAWVSAQDGTIAQAKAAADSKIETWYQATAPTGLTSLNTGDLWVDSDNGQISRYTGSAWVLVNDNGADAVATKFSDLGIDQTWVNDIESQSDKAITTFFGTATPTGMATGDLWLTGTAGDPMKRYSGTAWVTFEDPNVQNAYQKASDAESLADSKIKTYAATTAPTGLLATDAGDLWINTTAGSGAISRWSGSAWQLVNDNGAALAAATLDAALKTAASSSENKVANYSFESGFSGWTNTRAGVDTTKFRSGVQSAKVTGGANNTLGPNSSAGFNVVAGETWRFGLWYQTSVDYNGTAAWGKFRVGNLSEGANNGIINSQTFLANQTSWTWMEFEYKVPTGTTKIGLEIGSDHTVGSIWFDDVEVRNLTELRAVEKAANDANTLAKSKVRTFAQSAAPTGLTADNNGDLWLDTDDGKISRWNGSTWIQVVDNGVSAANAALVNLGINQTWVNDIEAQADRAIDTFFGTTTPTGMQTGDLWLTGVAGEAMKRYNGSAWVDFEDPNIKAAYQSAMDAASAAAKALESARSFINPGTSMDGISSTISNLSVVSSPSAMGGKAIAKTGSGSPYWWDKSLIIPIDPNALYKLTARVRVVTPSSNGSGKGLYLGAYGYADADGSTFVNASGSNISGGQHWVVSNALVPETGEWYDYTGYMKGISAGNSAGVGTLASPRSFHVNAKYFSAGGILDYNGGNGVWELSHWTVDAIDPIGHQALLDAGDASNLAKTKIRTFAQTTAPTGLTVDNAGDLWINTTSGSINGQVKRWDGDSWELVVESGTNSANSALTALGINQTWVNDIEAQADRAIDTFYGTTTPVAPQSGDLWLSGVAGTPMKRFDGTSWVAFEDPHVMAAYERAGDALDAADEKVRTFAQTTAPTGLTAVDSGDLWINTTVGTTNGQISRWTGTAWSLVTDNGAKKTTTWYQAASPAVTGNTTGDIWFDTDDQNKVYAWNGSAWVSARDAGIDIAITAANGKNTNYYQTGMPTGGTYKVGDLWVDTDDGNKLYSYNGTTFVSAQDAGIGIAQASANGKNKVHYSIADASGTVDPTDSNRPFVEGDTWFKKSGTLVVAQWEFTGGAWVSRKVDGLVIANIDAGTITVGDLLPARVKAGSIDVSKLTVADFTNLLDDPMMSTADATNIAPGWTEVSTPSASSVIFDANEKTNVYRLNGVSAEVSVVNKNVIAVTSADKFYLSCRNYSTLNNTGLVRVSFYTDAMVFISLYDLTIPASASTWATRGLDINTIPATAKWMKISLIISASNTSGYILYGSPTLRRKNGGELIVDGAIDGKTITGSTIQTEQTASRGIKLTAAEFAGYDTAGVKNFSLTSAGVLSLKGSITSGSTITGATVTGSTIQTESTANRGIKLTTTELAGYDAAGVKNFQLTTGGTLAIKGDITAGSTITGATVTGSTIQTEVTASRGIKLTSGELAGYDTAGVKNFSLTSAGVLALKGSIESGSTIKGATLAAGTGGIETTTTVNRGVKIKDTGIVTYDAAGNMTFKVDAATGLVEAPGIKANSITGDKIAAKTIDVSKLTVQDFSNYVENPGFETGDLTGWDVVGGWTVNTAAPHSGTYKALVAYNGTVQSITNKAEVTLPVDGKVRVKFRIYSETPSVSGVQASVALYNVVGGALESVTNIVQTGQWFEIDRELTATTAGAKRLQISTSGAGTGYLRVDSVVMNRMMNGELIVDGAIDGKEITGATIQTEKTASRGIKLTSTELAGYDAAGVKNFSLTSAGALTIKGAIQTGGTISGTQVTGSLGLQTSTSATAGVKVNNQGIVAYDGSNNMTFKLDAATGYLELPGLKANSITGDKIASQTITAKSLLVGDFNNLATINENIPVTISSYGQTMVSAGYNKLVNDAGTFLMFTDQRGPVPFAQNDTLYFEMEAKATTSTTTQFGVWTYDSVNANSSSISSVVTISSTSATVTGEVKVVNYRPNAVQFVLGLNGVANKGIQVRNVKVYKKSGGQLIVDGAIRTNHFTSGTIDGGVISAGSLTAAEIKGKSITVDKLVVSSTDNLVVEADFGNGGASWGTLNANKAINSTAGRGGMPALRVTGSTALQSVTNLVNKVTVGSEDRFRGSFYIKSSVAAASGVAKLRMNAYTTATANTSVVVATSPALSANAYTLVEGYSPALPAGTIAVEFVLDVQNAATGTITDIDYVAVTRAADGRLVVDGAIDGKTITGALVRTGTTNNRVQLDSLGLRAFDANGVETVNISAVDGTLSATGDLSSYGLTTDFFTNQDVTVRAILGNKMARNSWVGYDYLQPGVYFERQDGVPQTMLETPQLYSRRTTEIAMRSAHAILEPTTAPNNVQYTSFGASPYSAGLGATLYDRTINEDGGNGLNGILQHSSVFAQHDYVQMYVEDGYNTGYWGAASISIGGRTKVDTGSGSGIGGQISGAEMRIESGYDDPDPSTALVRIDRDGELDIQTEHAGNKVQINSTGNGELWLSATNDVHVSGNLVVDTINGAVPGAGQSAVQMFTASGTMAVAAVPVPQIGALTTNAGGSTSTLATAGTGQITITEAGVYDISYSITLGGPMTGRTFLDITPSGQSAWARYTIAVGEDSGSAGINGVKVDAGQVVKFYCFQTSGGTTAYNAQIRLVKVGAPSESSNWTNTTQTVDGDVIITGSLDVPLINGQNTLLQHAEFTNSQSVPTNTNWGPGDFVLDSANSINSNFATAIGYDQIQINQTGIYQIDTQVNTQTTSATSTQMVVSRGSDGQIFAGGAKPVGAWEWHVGATNVYLTAGDTIKWLYFQNNGASQTWLTRVRITKVGALEPYGTLPVDSLTLTNDLTVGGTATFNGVPMEDRPLGVVNILNTATTTSGITTETLLDQMNVTVVAGRTYRLYYRCNTSSSGGFPLAAGTAFKTAATGSSGTTGTQLSSATLWTASAGNGLGATASMEYYWTPTTSGTFRLFTTTVRAYGSGTISIDGRQLAIEDKGIV